jgi:hypothetical protein
MIDHAHERITMCVRAVVRVMWFCVNLAQLKKPNGVGIVHT